MTFEEFEKEQAGFVAPSKPALKPRIWLGNITAKGRVILSVSSPCVNQKVVLQRQSEGVYKIETPLSPEMCNMINDYLPTIESHIEMVFDLKQEGKNTL